jgi:excisionase family DNA binding protein
MQDIDSDVNRAESLTLTIPETAQLLGISVSKTYEAARLGQLPTIKVGTRVLVSRRRLQEFIDGSAS